MLELPSTRSADMRAGPGETGGGVHLTDAGGRLGRFNKRFGDFGLKK